MDDIFFDIKPLQSPFEYKKEILIVLKLSDSSEQNILFLSKILNALKLELNDCEVLRIDSEIMIGNILANFKKVLVFGIYPEVLGLNIQINPYRVHYLEKTTIIFSHGLQKLSEDNALKNTFWKSLQLMFELNQSK